MKGISTYDVGKLPKWAQRRIATLEMRIKEQRQTIREQANTTPTSIAVNEGFMDTDTDYWAPDESRIKFWLPDPDVDPKAERNPPTRARFIEFKLRDGVVEAYASHCLVLRARSGNVISLDTEGF